MLIPGLKDLVGIGLGIDRDRPRLALFQPARGHSSRVLGLDEALHHDFTVRDDFVEPVVLPADREGPDVESFIPRAAASRVSSPGRRSSRPVWIPHLPRACRGTEPTSTMAVAQRPGIAGRSARGGRSGRSRTGSRMTTWPRPDSTRGIARSVRGSGSAPNRSRTGGRERRRRGETSAQRDVGAERRRRGETPAAWRLGAAPTATSMNGLARVRAVHVDSTGWRSVAVCCAADHRGRTGCRGGVLGRLWHPDGLGARHGDRGFHVSAWTCRPTSPVKLVALCAMTCPSSCPPVGAAVWPFSACQTFFRIVS